MSSRTRTIDCMCMRACTETCEHVCVTGYIYSLRVCVCVLGVGVGGRCVFVCVRAFVRAGDSVSARVLRLSVCQFDFALYD